jgi:DNA-binding transcriptional regulator YiaG
MTITTPTPQAAELAERLRPEKLPPPGERRALRDKAGVTRARAAQALGINIKTLREWETRDRRIQARHLEAYQQLLRAFELIASEIPAEQTQK